MFQLCTRDEYRQVTILESGAQLAPLLAKARSMVNDENMENALTLAEKKKSFTAVCPELLTAGAPDPNLVYAGTNGREQHLVYDIAQDEESLLSDVLDNSEITVRFYAGTEVADRKNNLKTDFYAEDTRGRVITNVAEQALEGKTFYYIKTI